MPKYLCIRGCAIVSNIIILFKYGFKSLKKCPSWIYIAFTFNYRFSYCACILPHHKMTRIKMITTIFEWLTLYNRIKSFSSLSDMLTTTASILIDSHTYLFMFPSSFLLQSYWLALNEVGSPVLKSLKQNNCDSARQIKCIQLQHPAPHPETQ